jgi:hypothetical protein
MSIFSHTLISFILILLTSMKYPHLLNNNLKSLESMASQNFHRSRLTLYRFYIINSAISFTTLTARIITKASSIHTLFVPSHTSLFLLLFWLSLLTDHTVILFHC